MPINGLVLMKKMLNLSASMRPMAYEPANEQK